MGRTSCCGQGSSDTIYRQRPITTTCHNLIGQFGSSANVEALHTVVKGRFASRAIYKYTRPDSRDLPSSGPVGCWVVVALATVLLATASICR